MKKQILFLVCCLASLHSTAIDFYQPGDTLWVWAKSGLNIREQPDAHAKILGKTAFGGQVITTEQQDVALPYAIEVIKKQEGGQGLELIGYWAKIKYKNLTGYVFDAYLSKLPAMTDQPAIEKNGEDFHVSALKKHSKILKQTGQNKYDENDFKFVRYIFDKGYIVEISGNKGGWRKEMLFPGGLSLTEGYLIYAQTIKYDGDVLIQKGADFLTFELADGTLTIKKAGSFLVIFEEHSC